MAQSLADLMAETGQWVPAHCSIERLGCPTAGSSPFCQTRASTYKGRLHSEGWDAGATSVGPSVSTGSREWDFSATLLAMAGHDLRQPLRLITSSHDLLTVILHNEEQREELARAANATAQLALCRVSSSRRCSCTNSLPRDMQGCSSTRSSGVAVRRTLRNLIRNAIGYTPLAVASPSSAAIAARNSGSRFTTAGPASAPRRCQRYARILNASTTAARAVWGWAS
jgi:hypothetical protein